ncbi:uncharacterized protein LOC127060955 [Serinus canaria]|uniref:uncharacterized protein LOC127060955 n=1 Tax=Serinus canaria TaxID=9135 RepID=UPI0021CC5F74|nr:uncharacterized protein LOC127060955 [Serinus canaria]
MLCTLSNPGATPSDIRLRGLLDSGADVTILSLAAWPPEWPLDPVETPVTGLGGTAQCFVSQRPVLVANPEGQTAWEQLDQGHLEPSTSPWNTPVFCIKKKSGKWRLLQDLRKVNAVMEGMGTLQVGMPSPTMLPADWPILIVDLKDCFFTIPLHPNDRPKFAFTVPAINNAEPAQRYQWRTLPQGMRNSPAICQWYVAQALSGVRKQFPDARLYHYMDDILVAASTQDELLRIQPRLPDALHAHGLQVAPEKVQQQPPWKYLGVKILEQTICHQEVQFVHSVKTLNDAQKLVGVITWLRPYLGLTNAQLSPLYDLLKGDNDLKSPRTLTPEAQKALEVVQQAVSACQVHRIDPSVDEPFNLVTDSAYVADIAQRLGHSVLKEILGYAGYLRSVFALTCDRRDRIRPTGNMETVTNLKGIKRPPPQESTARDRLKQVEGKLSWLQAPTQAAKHRTQPLPAVAGGRAKPLQGQFAKHRLPCPPAWRQEPPQIAGVLTPWLARGGWLPVRLRPGTQLWTQQLESRQQALAKGRQPPASEKAPRRFLSIPGGGVVLAVGSRPFETK